MPKLELILYITTFLAVYMQVFLLVTFVQKRKSLKKSGLSVVDGDLPSISFLVPCWNEEQTMPKTVASLKSINYPKDKFFIILVDDGSTDNTWNEMQKFKNDSQIEVLTQKNGGKHSALNYALQYAKTDLVVSVDADTIIEENALREAVSYFVFNPELSSVAGNVLIKNPTTLVQKAQSIEYQMFSFSKKMLAALGGALVAPGAFSIFRAKDLATIGGWQTGNGLEDLELTYRLQVNGYKVDHCHQALAMTSGPKNIKDLFKQRLRWGYGFLATTIDYRGAIFNKKFGNFGFYTLPMALTSYMVILTIFFISWYYLFRFIYEKFLIYSLLGFDGLFNGFSYDWFYVNTKALVFLSSLLFLSIILNIFLGRMVSKVKDRKFSYLIYFFVIYSLIEPFWVLRSVWNAIVSNRPSWR